METPLLQLTNLTKSFGAVRALRGVSFNVRAGEVHALLGENGAGKSTLIKAITGAHQPDGGTIEIEGKPVTHLSPRASHELGIACIYQQPALFPDLSVAENIALGLEQPRVFRPVRWAARRARARELLRRVGANIDPDTEVRRLSMPEQQLVEIAKALGAGAKILILDEPTASLTATEVELLLAVLRDLRAQGVGVIYISHRLEEIFALADRVTVLRDGESVGTHPISEMNETSLIKLMIGREMSALFPTAESPPAPLEAPLPQHPSPSSPFVPPRLRGENSDPPPHFAPSLLRGQNPALSIRAVACASSGIRAITLEVRAGEILGLAGLVGAGRTELARILFGLTPATSGTIEIDGHPAQIRNPREAAKQGIAYVPEDRRRHGVILEMPIAANITLAIHPTFFPGGWLRSASETAFAGGYIRDLSIKTSGPDAPAGSLSGGNQQKVALARWLATKPKLLILDEPTQGVDIGAKAEIHQLIRRLARDGLAVLMISSDLPEILGMSDRIAVMRGGTITARFDRPATAHEVMSAALGQHLERGAPSPPAPADDGASPSPLPASAPV